MTRPSQSVGSFHFPYQRVLVTGANGAGKTWFAERLAQRCGLPWVNNDGLSLGTKWTYLPTDVIAQAQADAIAEPAWVLDGGASLVRADVLDRAEVVIWLDPPALVRVWRIVKRSIKFLGRTRPEHPKGNVEWPGRRQVRFAYKAWATDTRVRKAIDAGLKDQRLPIITLTSPNEVRRFLQL